jgi:hypothetical protein
MVIPKRIVILLSGIPATRKSAFARYLVREHSFAHYDLECHPRGWPHSELKETWDADRSAFVAQLQQYRPCRPRLGLPSPLSAFGPGATVSRRATDLV